jgi:DNA-binding NarL/FixJ family response regulator
MKILVVDDHALIREALCGVLKELEPAVEVVEADTAHHAIETVAGSRPPDLALLDLNLPDRNGLELLAEFRDRWPQIAVVVLSANQDNASIKQSLTLGAVGFIPKSSSRNVMLAAFKLIFAGGVYVPPEIFARTSAPTIPMVPAHKATDLGLTERQLEVLRLMMKGRSNKAICRALDLAEPTVKNHVTAILKALDATNRTEAVIAAASRGITTATKNED